MEVLTHQQWEKFWDDGYLRFGRVIDEAQVETLRSALDRVIAEELEREDDARPAAGVRLRPRPEGPGGARKARAIHQFVNMWKVAPEYRGDDRQPAASPARSAT